MEKGQIIRVERLTHAQQLEQQRVRDHLSFDIRELKSWEKGTITRVYSRSRYDVQIPGRAYPYEWVPTMEPAFLRVGQVVTLAFVGGHPGIPVILVRQTEKRPRLFLGPVGPVLLGLGEWPFERAHPDRASTSIWTPVELSHVQRISGRWDVGKSMTRIWDGQIYFHTGQTADTLVLSSSDHYSAFYDDGEYLPTHYKDGALWPTMGSVSATDFVLHPSDDGNLYFLWKNGISKASRSSLTTAWATVIGDDHQALSGTLFTAEGLIGCLTAKDHRLYMVTIDVATGEANTPVLLEQTAHPVGGFVADEPVHLVSGGTYDSGDWIYAGASGHFLTWWWDAVLGDIGTNDLPVNPWGFVNANSFWGDAYTLMGQRKPGKTAASMSDTTIYWGPEPEPNGLLSFCNVAGILQASEQIVPVPPPNEYFPTLPIYTSNGALIAEVKGWETVAPDGPYHTKDYFSPRMIAQDRIVVITVRLTWQSILETHVEINGQDDADVHSFHQRSNNPADPNYDAAFPASGYCYIRDRQYSVGDSIVKRSRRLVGMQTLQETFSLAGAKISSAPLCPQVESMFVSRGAHAPLLPPMHGSEWGGDGWGASSATALPAVAPFMGYDTSTYWPAHSSYFDLLAGGYYWSYGLYSNGGNRVGPVFSPLAGKPGIDLDILEGDPYYDPLNNMGYNRIRTSPKLGTGTGTDPVGYGQWGVSADANNNGSVDTLVNIPPPSAFRYEAVLHTTWFDLVHISDFANPLASSDGSLIIYPPRYGLEFPASALVMGGAKFALSTGSNSTHSWSGGTLVNRQMHNVTPTHADWQTDVRQTWVAHDASGNRVWTHHIEASEFTGPITVHQWGRPQCADGEMRLVHRINYGPLRLRRVNDKTGALIEDIELTPIEPHLPEGDSGGRPLELILSGDISAVVTALDERFNWETFEVETFGHAAIHGLYPTP